MFGTFLFHRSHWNPNKSQQYVNLCNCLLFHESNKKNKHHLPTNAWCTRISFSGELFIVFHQNRISSTNSKYLFSFVMVERLSGHIAAK